MKFVSCNVAIILCFWQWRYWLPPSYFLETWKIHPVFHASLLTPYKETKYHGMNFLEPPPIEIEGGEPEWEVEKILRDWTYRKKKQYLIRWKDYSPVHDSWVDESDLHLAGLLSDYQAAQSAHQSASTNPSSQSAKDKNK